MKFKIRRSGKDGKDERYESFDVEPRKGMNLLEVLFEIQDRFDESLAFRYSCRGAVCGSCAMMINRETRLACRTLVSQIGKYRPMGLKPFAPLVKHVDWNISDEVLIEPLPNMPVLKDLVVDMTRFYDYYRKVKPFISSVEDRETRPILPEQRDKIDKWANCILCGACYGACPVCHKNPNYLGPHALAWSLRFIDDPRTESEANERLALVKDPDGAPACEWFYNCVRACPKNVAPAAAIRILRDRLAKLD